MKPSHASVDPLVSAVFPTFPILPPLSSLRQNKPCPKITHRQIGLGNMGKGTRITKRSGRGKGRISGPTRVGARRGSQRRRRTQGDVETFRSSNSFSDAGRPTDPPEAQHKPAGLDGPCPQEQMTSPTIVQLIKVLASRSLIVGLG
jgi:hypothetical protein